MYRVALAAPAADVGVGVGVGVAAAAAAAGLRCTAGGCQSTPVVAVETHELREAYALSYDLIQISLRDLGIGSTIGIESPSVAGFRNV
jgi:hypothetical protein